MDETVTSHRNPDESLLQDRPTRVVRRQSRLLNAPVGIRHGHVGILANLLPAYRATRIEPVSTLREE